MSVVFSVVLAGLYNAARGSVLPVVLCHWSYSLAVQLALPEVLGNATPLFLVAAGLFALGAALFAIATRARAGEGDTIIL